MNKDRRKPFTSLEKDLLLNIMQKYTTILSSAYKSRHTWERIAEEFNSSSIVTQQASTNEVFKLWYRLKAEASESRMEENDYYLTEQGPGDLETGPVYARVMDLDSETDGNVIFVGHDNEEYWARIIYKIKKDREEEEELINVTEIKTRPTRKKEVNYLKSQVILEEDESAI